jgi:hypothetical protein
MTADPSERRSPVAWVRRVVGRVNRWQPCMPHLWFRWLEDVPFAAACLVLAVTGRDDAFRFTMGCLLAGSVLAQARYAANRVRRGQRP